MKIRFKCFQCGEENEFETDGSIMELREAIEIDQYDIYIVNCRSCGAENRIKVKKESND